MTVHRQDAVRVFRYDVSTLVKAEHSCRIAIGLAAVPDLRFIDLPREALPYAGRKLHAHADIDLVIGQANLFFFAPLCKELAAGTSYGKK